MKKPSRKSAERVWKEKIKERAKYTCELCYRKDIQLHAHHIERKQSTYMLLYLGNGICLCAGCHMSIHGINGLGALDEVRGRLDTIRGKSWLDRLKRLKNSPPKVSIEEMLKKLKTS